MMNNKPNSNGIVEEYEETTETPGIQITPESKVAAEEQIIAHHRIIDYDTREYPVEVIVEKYTKGKDDDDNDFFIPDYQRELVWSDAHQSRFIESVLMGIPIPLLFVADVQGQEGRVEIVDGSQRVRSLARFMSDELCLSELKILTALNGFRFSDLCQARQRRFGRHTIRMIELREGIQEEVRRDIFSRINTGSKILNDMEVRWGSQDGPFLQFIRKCSVQELFRKLAPLSEAAINRREAQEFVLRFFAYLNNYQNFDRRVVDFLDDYLKKAEAFSDNDYENANLEWNRMLKFVNDVFPNGFSKAKGHVRTPRIRFEAIAVGSALALRDNSNIVPVSIAWLDSETFKGMMRSDASNSRPKIIKRIEYVRDQLLGR